MPPFRIHDAFAQALRLQQAGQLQDAEHLYRQILNIQPDHAPAMHFLGVIAHQVGVHDAAADLIRKSIAIQPDYFEAFCNLGLVLLQTGQLDEAVDTYQKAIAIKNDSADCYFNLGNAFRARQNIDDAIAAYRQAIKLKPDFTIAYCNLGNCLAEQGLLDESLALFRTAIKSNRNHPNPHYNLGVALRDRGEIKEAIAAFRKAVALEPNYDDAYSNLLLALNYDPTQDGRSIADELKRWNSKRAQPLAKPIPPHLNDPDPQRRLRIGYVSPDFRDHVVGQNLMPLFRQHDRQQFEIYCYANVRKPDAMTGQFRGLADHWRDTQRMSDDQLAAHIREDRIDILVDLALHTADNRLLVFARKPAPVQVTYLGYCGSTGLTAMDYRLSDPFMDPLEIDESHFSEKTFRLPASFWCYEPRQSPDPAPSPMLKNGFITFGSLNNPAKVSATVLQLWSRLLLAVPTAQMILHSPPGEHLASIQRLFETAGVDKSRLNFVGRQSAETYLQTYSQIDIALDPFPFGGGITTCDALWMGVPVITLSGQTPVGRGGRSILSSLALPEFIASTPDQYLQIAIDLAKDSGRLAALRNTLRERMRSSPLMNASKFTADVESSYRIMWQNWCKPRNAAKQ